MEDKKEVHIFIVWEKARHLEEDIISEIDLKFKIIQTYSITWSPYQVGNNFTRFYGASLPKGSRKEEHCGAGEFKLVVVFDEAPNYENRQTSKGMRRVNVNMFDTKARLREITGGGHKIHGTDNEHETKHDLVLLTGLSIADFLDKYKHRQNDVIHRDDLIGNNGWDSFEQLFYVLNECSENIVLRNVENINLDYTKTNRCDVDLLAKNSVEIKYVLGDLIGINKQNPHMQVSIDKTVVLFDVYQSGTNLYPLLFEEELFRRKVKTNNMYHPVKEMEMYGLIYHALLMKRELQNKHKEKIFSKYSEYLDENDKSEHGLLNKLISYFLKNEYFVIKPNSGYFNMRPEIEHLLIDNKNRESSIKRKCRKIINIKLEDRKLHISILDVVKNKVLIEIEFIKGFGFYFNLGSK